MLFKAKFDKKHKIFTWFDLLRSRNGLIILYLLLKMLDLRFNLTILEKYAKLSINGNKLINKKGVNW